MPGTLRRWVWAAVCLVLVSLPFLAVDFVPSTDLPQHLGQLRLLGEAWSQEHNGLSIQWWTPYGLVYALMALPWAVLSPVAAGRVSLWLLVLLGVGAVHLIAAKCQRPLAGAILATLFVFNAQLYWGFLNFLFGFLAFVCWYLLSRRSAEKDESDGWRTAGLFLAVAGVLYLSHALWFACGLLWLAIEAWLSRRSAKNLLWRAVGVGPVVLCALYWFTFLSHSDFSTAPEWTQSLLMRLHPLVVAQVAFGGLWHGIETPIVLIVVLWVVASVVSRRKERCFGCDPYLLSLAGLFFVLYLVLPDKFSHTIRFSARWLPLVFVSLVLAVGRPRLRQAVRRAAAVAILGTYMVVTTAFWQAFEANELDGLAESLAAIEGEPRVLGLSYLGASRYVRGRPFVQIFSWAYAVHGGTLNMSFADTPMSPVVYKDADRLQWTIGLEWVPKGVRRSDFSYFDYTLVGGDESAHQTMLRLEELEPLVTEGVWRLYRIDSSGGLPLAPVSAP